MFRFVSRAATALLIASIALAAGCGSKSKLVPVSGVVLIDGEPVPYGKVQVAPAGFRPAIGTIGPDGRFTLTTLEPNDGCVLGTHPVAVIAHQTLSPTKERWHAPRVYAATDTSNLTVTITGPTNDLKIELTWAGGKPFDKESEKE